jgi:hypothetical protein
LHFVQESALVVILPVSSINEAQVDAAASQGEQDLAAQTIQSASATLTLDIKTNIKTFCVAPLLFAASFLN